MNLKNIKDGINPAYNLGAFLSYEQVFNRVPYPAMDKSLWNMAVENVFEGRRQIIKGWSILQEYKRLKAKETQNQTTKEQNTKELKPTQNQLNLFDAVDFDIEKVDDNTFNVVRDNKVIYTVTKNKVNYTCTCPAFKFRGKCKHIEEVMNLLSSPAPKVEPKNKRHPRSEFEKFIPELTELCEPFDLWEAVGSWRREKSDFRDVDVIALGKSGWKQVHENLENSGAWEQIIYGDTLMRGMYHGYYLDFNLCPSEKNWVWWLLYRTGCFVEDTRVLTPSGYRNIQDIMPGDLVFSGKGKITRVLGRSVYENKRVVLVSVNGNSIRCTPNHEFYTVGCATQGKRYAGGPKWKSAKDLSRYSQLVQPLLQYEHSIEIPVNLAFLVGLYAADGNIWARESSGKANRNKSGRRDYGVELKKGLWTFCSRISLESSYITQYQNLFSSLGIPIDSESGGRGNEYTLKIRDKLINSTLVKYAHYTHKKTGEVKKLSKEVLNWSDESKNNLLAGFFLGDGTFAGTTCKFLNSNEQMINVLWLVAKSLYSCTDVEKAQPKNERSLPLYSFSIKGGCSKLFTEKYLNQVKCCKGSFKDCCTKSESWYDLTLSPSYTEIVRCKPTPVEGLHTVYDLQVECETHSYLVEGYVVHNSADFNVEMRKRAIAMGYALSEQPLKDRFTFKEVDYNFNTEEDIFTFLGFEYLEPKYREPQNLRTIKGWVLNPHKSPGLKALESGNFDWKDYILSVIETAKSNAIYTKQAKYPARLAIVIARELARRTGKSENFILSFLDPDEIQPEGFKAGQQLWDKNGNIYRA